MKIRELSEAQEELQTIKLTGSVDSDMDYYIWGVNEVTS